MASSKEYLDYILDQLSGLDSVTYRAMMGEYLLYYRGTLVGGIYDNRLLVKDVPGVRALLPDAPRDLPYEGAKPMLLVEDPDHRELLARLFGILYDELPAKRNRN